MYTVYILQSTIADKSYVGMTDNIERRIDEHNAGKSLYTKKYTPWNVLHTEVFSTRDGARRREKYLKSASGRKFLRALFK